MLTKKARRPRVQSLPSQDVSDDKQESVDNSQSHSAPSDSNKNFAFEVPLSSAQSSEHHYKVPDIIKQQPRFMTSPKTPIKTREAAPQIPSASGEYIEIPYHRPDDESFLSKKSPRPSSSSKQSILKTPEKVGQSSFDYSRAYEIEGMRDYARISQKTDNRLIDYDTYKQSMKRKPALSPRVFNFYELSQLSPANIQHTEAPETPKRVGCHPTGSKASPIILPDDAIASIHSQDALLKAMSGKSTDTSIADKVSLAEPQCVCNICYKLCSSRTDLLLHQHCHRNSCPVCGETFSKKELLQTHMLQHCPNTEHYVCNIEGCNRRFSNSGLLQRHIEHEHVTSPAPHLTTHGSPRPHRSSESSDWSPQLLPHHSPTVCSPSFRTPSVSWRLSESPSARQEYIRSPSTPLTSPLCRRSIGSEGGPFKPYRSPGPTRDVSQSDSWRPQTPRTLIEEQLKYIHDVSMLQPQITQLISQQVYAQQQNMTSPNEATKKHSDVLFEHHIVKSQQAPFLYRENRSITVGVTPQHILTPQPMKASDSLLSKQTESLKHRTSSTGDIEHRTMTPEPSPNISSDSKHNLVSSLAGVENMEGLELLGQVSSQLSRMHEVEPMKTKQRPAPLEIPQEVQFALTPPYTGTPRYLWTPTKSASATYQNVSFFSPSIEQPKIRVGREWQADIPDLQPKDSPPALPGSPLYTPPVDCDEIDKREEFFSSYSTIFPNSEYLHHCIHLAGGDLNRASKLARCPVEPCMPETHPLYKYRYTVGWRWGYEDQQKFSTLFQQLGKNLPQIARWMPDKSTADVIEYYYFWKKRYPEAYKLWRHRQPEIKIEPPEIRPTINLSTADTIHYHPYEVPPAQRPAPAKAKRGRNKEIVYFETEAYTTHDAKGNKEIKFRQKKVVNPYNDYRPRNKPAPQPLGSYKCKVCGKEFQKVKSRSAHMKTHKRQQNNALAAAAQQQAQQQQQQQQVQQQVQQQQLQAAQQQLLTQVPSLHMPPQAPT